MGIFHPRNSVPLFFAVFLLKYFVFGLYCLLRNLFLLKQKINFPRVRTQHHAHWLPGGSSEKACFKK